ncbi:MAG: hypothetical protein IT448_12620 [Phycisphaerales bacterium]|nr:hypothetical protein [Phycisphaerales bacterium]
MTATNNGTLRQQARIIEDWVEDAFIDPNGVFYTYLDTKTGGPLTDASFAPDQVPMHLPGTEGYTPAEWHNYENCGMTTAAYLQALLYQYAIDNDPVAMKRARRCFDAIKYIYDMGRQLEEGFFPKIYGNRFSEQTSTDQVLYVMLALDHLHHHANSGERKEIARMITHLIQFWVKRGYRYKYFWHEDMLWPLGRFPSLLLMGYRHSGDAVLKREYDRLLAMGVNENAVELRLAPKLTSEYSPIPYETKHQAWLIGEMEGTVSMDMMELDYLLRNDPGNRWAPNWKASMKKVWSEGELALAPDGTMYVHVLVDMKTRKPRRPDPEFFREAEGPNDWLGFRYVSGGRSSDSTFHARSAVQADRHLRDPEMRRAARHIIKSIDRQGLRAYYDPERYPPELKHRTELYSGDATANWLWAYWQGRNEGVFNGNE